MSTQKNILIVGDAFIPARAARIPAELYKRLRPEHVDAVICTGNLNSSHVLEYLKSLSPDVIHAKSPLDEPAGTSIVQKTYGADEEIYAEKNGIRFAAINGHQTVPHSEPGQLCRFAKQLEADVLCASGPLLIQEKEDTVIIRPGSITGVYGNPSLVMATTDGKRLRFFSYELIEGEIKVTPYEIQKVYREEKKPAHEETSHEESEKEDSEKGAKQQKKQKQIKFEEEESSSIIVSPKKKAAKKEPSDDEDSIPAPKKAKKAAPQEEETTPKKKSKKQQDSDESTPSESAQKKKPKARKAKEYEFDE